MTNSMRWMGLAGSASLLLMSALGGCVIKNSSSDGDGGSTGSGDTSGDTTTATTGSQTTATTGATGTGGYGGGSATTTTAGVGGASTCDDYDPNDACETCFATSCCAEIEACDAACQAAYGAYAECIAPGGVPSGYNTNYCKLNNGATAGTPVAALIDCAATACFTANACGAEAPQETWTNFAAGFVEQYCVGCHTDNYTSPNTGIETAQYRKPGGGDPNFVTWFEPFEDANWFAQMDYTAVVNDGDMFWCGISKDLPAECANEFPGKFPSAQRFPPPGNGVNNLHCWWTDDFATCEQPTDLERAQINNWIFAGYPQ